MNASYSVERRVYGLLSLGMHWLWLREGAGVNISGQKQLRRSERNGVHVGSSMQGTRGAGRTLQLLAVLRILQVVPSRRGSTLQERTEPAGMRWSVRRSRKRLTSSCCQVKSVDRVRSLPKVFSYSAASLSVPHGL